MENIWWFNKHFIKKYILPENMMKGQKFKKNHIFVNNSFFEEI